MYKILFIPEGIFLKWAERKQIVEYKKFAESDNILLHPNDCDRKDAKFFRFVEADFRNPHDAWDQIEDLIKRPNIHYSLHYNDFEVIYHV